MSTKTIQGKLWSVAPSLWSRHFEPYFMPIYRRALEFLKLGEDKLLLDAGCGSGLFCSLAIETGTQVIGIDAAPGLLEVARQRNPQNNFMEEDLELLPFANNSFDIVTGFNSFQFAGDVEKALSEASRVLKKDGKLIIGIWDKPELSDATRVLKAIGSLLPPPPPGTPSPFALSEDGKLEELCAKLGLKLLRRTKVSCPFLYGSTEDGIKSFMSTGPAAAATDYTDKETVEKTIEKALKPFRITEELYYMQNNFLLFVAEK